MPPALTYKTNRANLRTPAGAPPRRDCRANRRSGRTWGARKEMQMYPMIDRYEMYGSNIEGIVNFIDWLSRFKKIELTHANGATVNDIETLAMQFHGIDKKQLEMERRALIAANKAVTG